MTRKEEIEKAAHQKYPYEGGTLGMICERSIPTFIQGAEWADKTMIDKACEWLMLYGCEYATEEVMVEHFKKAMEE